MFLMEVRDKAFHLLVKRHGGVTPLVHAMRCGKSHQDVTIVILGAFSRYINHLSDEDFDRPATKVLLRELRMKLRASEHERGQLAAKQGDVAEARKAEARRR